MLRIVLAIVIGVLVAVVMVFVVQVIGHNIYPVAVVAAVDDPEAMKNFIATLPVGALLFVPLSGFIGSLTGGIAAVAIARQQPMMMAAIVAGFILVAAITTLLSIPHPLWLTALGIGAIAVSAPLAARIGAFFATGRVDGAEPEV